MGCTAARHKAMAAGSSSIEITVLNLGGGEIARLTAEPEVTMKALKEELARKIRLPGLRQSLTYNDRVLEDTETGAALGWSGAVSIYMIAKSVDLDGHITCLRRQEMPTEKAGLPEGEIRILCDLVEEIFMQEPVLLELEPPLVVGGTLASSVGQLNQIIERCGEPGEVQYLFLGNYVSRGRMPIQGVDLLTLLYCFKCRHPCSVFLLRGKQECASISRVYGFYDECKRLSPELLTLDQLGKINRPTEVPDTGLLCDLLWADPETGVRGWAEMDKGVSYVFGEDIVHGFLERNSLDLICRTSQVVEDGYEYFADRKLVTLFSCANYVGEFDNTAAVMLVDAEMQHTFVTYH
ncbi:Serine/threonine-protein phosphatase PP1 isozyme 2 [Symbiodinium microadriaticum]|uniref:protein-serine/threonine phosphatase n=1 Tax=Symbiodinium microadriaticum TaxID=2951 RepID=A0A1Q9DEH9_SYMMI|nr:Serine/threonine-protein phosphatase PP1 isozyme 2 [Symbiodinium microadriaticum]